tara:strand:- start:12910 stop:13212 length:303 start_codon:yes stop_codon:yes gene_type:complete
MSKKKIYSRHGPPRKAIEDVWSPFMCKDPKTGKWPVPKEGDEVSEITCDACRYEHNMQLKFSKWAGRKILFCYRCDNFALPPKETEVIPPPPPVKKVKRD